MLSLNEGALVVQKKWELSMVLVVCIEFEPREIDWWMEVSYEVSINWCF